MATNLSVVVEGVLKADDTIELASHPSLPPGPVRVKLEALYYGLRLAQPQLKVAARLEIVDDV